jgi:MFS transporter, DHA2 family, multidrug resistance protein
LWTLPSVLAYLAASFAGPALTRFLPAGRVIALGLATMAAGFALMALGGLGAVLAGMIVYSVGLAPAYILTTELVVSAVRPERAGMAAAVTETGCELGGALGIAVLGSLVVAVYRHGSPLPGTLADAVSIPAARGSAIAAFGTAFTWMSLTAAVLVAVAAVLAARVLRPAVVPSAAPTSSAVSPSFSTAGKS